MDLSSYSFITQLATSFFFGVLTSLTPCVYPMIPITIGIFSGSDHSKKNILIKSLLYTLGMVVTYSFLGYLAVKLGFVFGGQLGNSTLAIFLAVLVYSFGLIDLDIIHFEFAGIRTSACKVGGSSHYGAFTMGAVSGIVGAPCVGPNALAILALISNDSTTFEGVLALAFYAFGLSSVVLAFVIFGKRLFKFAKPGAWLENVKILIAVLVFMVAIRIIATSGLLSWQIPLTILIPLLLAGIGFMFIKSKYAKLVSTNFIAFSLYFLLFPIAHNNWNNSYEDSLALAKQNKKLIFMDLKAKWCTACGELEEKTFTDIKAKEFLSRYNLLSLDVTEDSPEQEKLFEKYNIQGLPTMLVLDQDGNAVKRIDGFVTPDELIEKLN